MEEIRAAQYSDGIGTRGGVAPSILHALSYFTPVLVLVLLAKGLILRQGKPWQGGCDELKPCTASQQVRHLPGRGAVRQPGARVAWRAAMHVVKRTQRVVKLRYGASKSSMSMPSFL